MLTEGESRGAVAWHRRHHNNAGVPCAMWGNTRCHLIILLSESSLHTSLRHLPVAQLWLAQIIIKRTNRKGMNRKEGVDTHL